MSVLWTASFEIESHGWTLMSDDCLAQSHKNFAIYFFFFTVLLSILHADFNITTPNYALSVFLDALHFFTSFCIDFFICQWKGMRIVGRSLNV